MAFWVHVEKGYTIFIVYFSSFKSLESLESLARLLKKVLKSCETFKIQDFANATSDVIFISLFHDQNRLLLLLFQVHSGLTMKKSAKVQGIA